MVLWIALAIAASIAAGVEAERRAGARAGEWARGILKFLLYVVMPLVAFFNIARLQVDADVGVGIPLAWLALLITALVGWLIGRKVLHLEPPSAGVLAIVGLQANTGLLGVAVVAAVLGFDHVSQGVAYDALVQQPVFFIGSFAIAAATGTKAGETVRERVKAFFTRNPPLIAVALGLIAPESLAPDVLVDISHVLVLIVPVLGFFAIGVTLAEEAEEGAMKFPPPFTPQIAVAILLRSLVVPGRAARAVGGVHRPAGGVPADGGDPGRPAHRRARPHLRARRPVRGRRDHVDDDGRGAHPARRVRHRSLTTFFVVREPCAIRRVRGAPLSRLTRLRPRALSRSRIVTVPAACADALPGHHDDGLAVAPDPPSRNGARDGDLPGAAHA